MMHPVTIDSRPADWGDAPAPGTPIFALSATGTAEVRDVHGRLLNTELNEKEDI